MENNDSIGEIFEEYERSLQGWMEQPSIPMGEFKQDMFCMFNGMVENFVDSLRYAKHKIEPIENVHYLESLNVQTNSFLDKPSFYVLFIKGSNEEGAFFDTKCYYDMVSDKMPDAKFMYTESEKDYPNIRLDEFRKVMFHELQHAYRHYQILKKEDEKKARNTKPANGMDAYSRVLSDKAVDSMIKKVFYFTDINEINSHFSEIYPYIKGNTDINIRNYKGFLEEIPGYEIIGKLKRWQNYFNNSSDERSHGIEKQIGDALCNVYSKMAYYRFRKLTPGGCFRMMKDRLNKSLLYAEKKFYEFLNQAFTELGRL